MTRSGVSITGLGDLTKRLEKIVARANGSARGEGASQIAEQVTREGYESARDGFRDAEFEGEKDVEVSTQPGQIGGAPWEINASGKTVLFIEFGTGILWNTDDHPLKGKFGYYATSWSEKDAGWLIEPKILRAKIPGTWPYREPGTKLWHEGNPPSKTMYKAARKMHEKFDEIAIPVWSGKK